MSTTAGPKNHPRYTVFHQDRPVGAVHRDPTAPHRWIASYTGRDRNVRIDGINTRSRRAAVADVLRHATTNDLG